MIERFLASKVDVDIKATRYLGSTSLQAAAEIGYLAVVETLQKAKAEMKIKDARKFDQTAL